MPPPYQRNPVRSARSDFLGESPPRYYFPEPGKTSAFGPHFSGRQLSNLEFETDDFLTKKDDMLARRRDNAFRHLRNESDARVMPFEEEEKVAGARYGKTRAESMERVVPSEEEAAIERNKLGAGASRVGQQMLPGDEEVASQVQERKLSQASRIDALLSNDPTEQYLSKWTQNPNDLYNYRSILNRTDPKLPKAQREREAFRRSMRLVKDRDYINGLYEAVEDKTIKPEDLDQLLDADMDDDGNFYGSYIKPDKAARARVERIVASNRIKKQKMAQEKEARIASQAYDSMKLRAMMDEKDSLEKRLLEFPKDAEAKAEMAAIKAEIASIWRNPKGASSGPTGQPDAQGTAAPPVKADESTLDPLSLIPKR